jgi:hypothetical protein
LKAADIGSGRSTPGLFSITLGSRLVEGWSPARGETRKSRQPGVPLRAG